MVYTITFFRDKGKAKAMMLIFGIFAAILLLVAGGIKLYSVYKLNSFEKVVGVVTDQSTIFDSAVYTDISYQVNGEEYTKRFTRYFSNTDEDGNINLLCNPATPEEPEILDYVGAEAPALFVVFGIVGAFFVIFFINYILVCKREKKNSGI